MNSVAFSILTVHIHGGWGKGDGSSILKCTILIFLSSFVYRGKEGSKVKNKIFVELHLFLLILKKMGNDWNQ